MSLKITVETPPGDSSVKSTFEVPLGTIDADGADAVEIAAAISRFLKETASTNTASNNSTPPAAAEASRSSGKKRKQDSASDTPDDSYSVLKKQKSVVPELQLNVSRVGNNMTVNTPIDATVGTLEKLIGSQLGESAEQQRLVCGGERLKDDRTLFDLI